MTRLALFLCLVLTSCQTYNDDPLKVCAGDVGQYQHHAKEVNGTAKESSVLVLCK